MIYNPLLSVVIPTYHRNDLLAKCLDRLAPNVQTLASDQYEVIASDDGHESTAEDMIRQNYPWVKWVAGPRKGPAANRNNGAKYAQGEWLAFTDDDCLPDSDWLSEFSKAISEGGLALEGSIHPLGDLNQDLAECPVNLTGGCFWSANIAVARSLFEKVNGFDENYILAAQEDQDLKIRLEVLTEILFVPQAKVLHPVRILSLKKAIASLPAKSKNWSYYVVKNNIISHDGGVLQFVMRQYKFGLLILLRNLFNARVRGSILSATSLVYGYPIGWFYLFRAYYIGKTINNKL